MTTIWHEEPIATSADEAWTMLRCLEKTHALFAPVLVACALAEDIRTVTFANGRIVRERIVTIDEARRRMVYCVLGEMFELHMASMQLLPVDEQNCRFVWISDFLPEDRSLAVEALVKQGSKALATNISSAIAPTRKGGVG